MDRNSIPPELYLGLMSGTSLDGIDVALIQFSEQQVQLLAAQTYPLPSELKQSVLAMCTGQQTTLLAVGKLDYQLGCAFAQVVQDFLCQTGYQPEQILAIGSHGQTVYHYPEGETPFTMQLGDPHLIAAKTQIDTVADFRRKDMAYGGEGAPLVPAFHREIFSSMESSVVVLNIGGIANITVLRADQPLLGYDVGPGNMLMDAWCSQHFFQPFDQDANWAKQGKIILPLLDSLLSEPYLKRTPPKSTGRELFNMQWLQQHLQQVGQEISPKDVLRTLCEFTALAISEPVNHYRSGPAPMLWVCGGGVHNPLLIERLKVHLAAWQIGSTDDCGISSDYMEAMAFAWLAQRRMHRLASNVPEVTGASQAVSLGGLFSANA